MEELKNETSLEELSKIPYFTGFTLFFHKNYGYQLRLKRNRRETIESLHHDTISACVEDIQKILEFPSISEFYEWLNTEDAKSFRIRSKNYTK